MKSVMVLLRNKSTGDLESKQMSGTSLVEWFKANSDEEGNVREEIIQFSDAELKAAGDEEFDWMMSDYSLDRDVERIDPEGWDLRAFKKNPVVLWAHGFFQPAIGRIKHVKVEDGKLVGRVIFDPAEIDPFAGMIAAKVKAGTISAGSVGYRSTKVEFPQQEEGDKAKKEQARLISRKQELYEFSVCNVPANVSALVRRDAAKEIETAVVVDEAETEAAVEDESKRAVIPYKDLGKADEDDAWDAGKEVRAADTADLKQMCAWYDAENPDVKGSYKLPHHRQADKKAVWRGVAAAMGALLGARGGVSIPAGDRRGVYNHLAKHYKAFDKEPPEFKGIGSMILELLLGIEDKIEKAKAPPEKGGDNYIKKLFVRGPVAPEGQGRETSGAVRCEPSTVGMLFQKATEGSATRQ